MTVSRGSQRPRVLIVEDEPKLAGVLRDYLERAGFACQCLDEGLRVLETVRAWCPDIVLLDWLLPGRDGLAVCRALRECSDLPIIMITARTEELDRLMGLDSGADDYICKPFSPREVVARVQAVLRRTHRPEHPGATGIVLDEAGGRASLAGRALGLTAVEFRLLSTLVRSPGRVFSRDRLLDLLYADEREVTDRAIDSHVKNLRRKLHALDPEREYVHSVYGVGYRFET